MSRRSVLQSVTRGLLTATTLLLLGAPAWAQDEQREAAAHFEQGMRLIDKHAYSQAIPEFEAAYRLSPHPTVLYNLGQAHAALGHPSRAIAAFRRMLEEHSSAVGAEQRRAVSDLIVEQRARLGKVVLRVEPAEAQISIDGEASSRQAASEGLELDPGGHVVEVKMVGQETRRLQIQVVAGKAQTLSVYMSGEGSTARPSAQLHIDCEIPDVTVEVDGADAGITPLAAPLMVDARPHRLRLNRAGYRGQDLVVELGAREQRRVHCDLRPSNGKRSQGVLAVYVDQPDAQVLLDGGPLGNGEVPAGRHQLRVEHWGFEPWTRTVDVAAGGKESVRVQLEPKPSYAQEHQRVHHERRVWAYVLGAAGLATAGAAVGLIVYNGERASDWRATQASLDARWLQGRPDATLVADQDRNDALSDSVQLTDKVTVGLATAGGLLLLGGVGLYLSSDDPSRYARVQVGTARTPAGATWTATW